MSSPARGSRTPRKETGTPTRSSSRRTPTNGSQTPSRDEDPSRTPRRETDTPTRRSSRRTPTHGSQTPSRDDDPPRTPRRTPGKSRLPTDGLDGTPMRLGAPRQIGNQDASSDLPATSPAHVIIPTSPAARESYSFLFQLDN